MHMCSICSDIHSPLLSMFNDDERRSCLPTIAFILRMAKAARNEGILALEELVSNEGEPFGFLLKMGTDLIIDGTNPELVKVILENFVKSSADVSSGRHSVDTLRRILITEGILSIQAGEHPVIICTKMLSMLGENLYKEAGAYLGINADPKAEITAYFNTLPESGDNKSLDDLLEHIGTHGIQLILRETNQNTLVKAMRGLTKASQKRICENLSLTLAYTVVTETEACRASESEIEHAQSEIIGIYEKLRIAESL